MSRSILDFRHLCTLRAIRDSGSLSRAAQMLNLTQAAISHQIKMLEEHYGSPLFHRRSSPITFTPVGNLLLALADSVVPELDSTELEIRRLGLEAVGQLRIAVECHTCFDWLMPAMDEFRPRWPEVELDIVSGFHADPVGLIHRDDADLAIVSEVDESEALHYLPLFQFEIVALVANDHRLAAKAMLDAHDFIDETLISYPVPDDMLDVVRQLLRPAGVEPKRRTSELTVAILQLVASRRGIAALPEWAVAPYLARNYVQARSIAPNGMQGKLYAAVLPGRAKLVYMEDFVATVRANCLASLPGITLL